LNPPLRTGQSPAGRGFSFSPREPLSPTPLQHRPLLGADLRQSRLLYVESISLQVFELRGKCSPVLDVEFNNAIPPLDSRAIASRSPRPHTLGKLLRIRPDRVASRRFRGFRAPSERTPFFFFLGNRPLWIYHPPHYLTTSPAAHRRRRASTFSPRITQNIGLLRSP